MALKQFTRADDKIIVNMDKVMMMKEKDGFLRLYFDGGDFVDVKNTLKSLMRWYQKQNQAKKAQNETEILQERLIQHLEEELAYYATERNKVLNLYSWKPDEIYDVSDFIKPSPNDWGSSFADIVKNIVKEKLDKGENK